MSFPIKGALVVEASVEPTMVAGTPTEPAAALAGRSSVSPTGLRSLVVATLIGRVRVATLRGHALVHRCALRRLAEGATRNLVTNLRDSVAGCQVIPQEGAAARVRRVRALLVRDTLVRALVHADSVVGRLGGASSEGERSSSHPEDDEDCDESLLDTENLHRSNVTHESEVCPFEDVQVQFRQLSRKYDKIEKETVEESTTHESPNI